MSTPTSSAKHTVGVGMSRAAQKKRKRLSLTSGTTTPVKILQNLSETNPNSRTKTKTKSKSVDKKKSPVGKMTNLTLPPTVVTEFKVDITIQDLLELQEVYEITSEHRAKQIMQRILQPIELSSFYCDHWQITPCVVNRNDLIHWNKLLTLKQICNTLSKQLLIIGRDVLLNTSMDGKTLSKKHLPGNEIKYSDMITLCSSSSSSILVLNAVKHFDILWKLCSALEHEFSSPVGCRILLSCPSQNKSTIHYEVIKSEVDSFILQLEGNSEWMLSNVNEKELNITMQPGDSLYIPQGWSYRMNTFLITSDEVEGDNEPPIAITLQLFTNQFNSMADVLNMLLPQVLCLPYSK